MGSPPGSVRSIRSHGSFKGTKLKLWKSAALRRPGGWAAVPALQLSATLPAVARGAVPSFAELHYRMLEAFGPPSMLIDPNYEIVHISEHAGRYLQMAGGEPSRNLLRAAHPDIQLELRSLLIEASQMGQASRQISIGIDGKATLVEVSARSLAGTVALSGFTLVVFEEIEQGHSGTSEQDRDEQGRHQCHLAQCRGTAEANA